MADPGRLGNLFQLLDQAGAPPTGDAELLQEFALQRDERAFATLVQRHAGVVLGVCRRVLGSAADADDAFQVTFLILAQKAGKLRPEKSLACWLAKVAHHVALRARANAGRRREREGQALPAPRPDPARVYEWQELGPVLDDELNRLPEKLRAPLVLCGLQGQTNAEAAATLGWPVGSISKRLAEGRERLRGRLARQGFTVAATLPFVLAADASAATALLETTVKTAILFADSGTLAGMGAARVALLTGALRAMWLTRVKMASAALLVAAVVGIGFGLSGRSMTAAEPTAPQAPPVAAVAVPPPATVDLQGDALPPGALARLGTLRWRHGGDVCFAQWLADGRQLFTATTTEGQVKGKYQGQARLWDAATGEEVRRFPIGDEVGPRAALSADGKWFAFVGHNDRALRVFDVAKGELVARVPKPASIDGFQDLTFSPDSTVLATFAYDQICLWEPATGKLVREFDRKIAARTFQWPRTIAFAPDGKTIARAYSGMNKDGLENGILFYDVATGKELPGIRDEVQKVADARGAATVTWAPDGQSLFRVQRDGVVVQVDRAGKELRRFGQPQPVVGGPARLALSPDGKLVAARDHSYALAFRVWEVATGKEVQAVRETAPYNRLSPADVLMFTPDGQRLGAITGNTIRQFDARGREVTATTAHGSAVTYLSLTPDGRTALTAGDDSTVRVWDVAGGKPLATHPLPRWVRGVAFAPDGKTFAYEGDEGVRLCTADTGKEIRAFNAVPKAERGIAEYGLAFSPDGTLLAAKSGKQGDTAHMHLWEVASGRLLWSVPTAEGSMFQSLVFSPDGNLLAAAEPDGPDHARLRLYHVNTGIAVRDVQPQRGYLANFAFAPDGRTLAATFPNDKAVSLWETATGRERARLSHGNVFQLAFSRDGRVLAATTYDDQIISWDVTTGQTLGRLRGVYWMRHLQFTPDGRRLLTANQDTTAIVWDASPLTRRPAVTAAPAADVTAAWATLAGDDGKAAWTARATLLSAPDAAVAMLRERLKPTPAAHEAQIRGLISDLESDVFATRQRASVDLEKLGPQAERALRQALAAGPPLETRQRLEQILDAIARQHLSAEEVQAVRAVEVLEQLASADARALLASIAAGAAAAPRTQAAKQALQRLLKP